MARSGTCVSSPAEDDFAGCSIEGDPVAFRNDLGTYPNLTPVDVYFERRCADDRRLAELSCYQRGVAGAAALARQNALGRQHPVNVVRLCFGPYEHNVFPVFKRPLNGSIGVEDCKTDGRAGRDVVALCQQASGADCLLLYGGVELGMKEKVDLFGADPQQSFLPGDETFVGEVDGDANLGLSGALSIARLEQPQRTLLDGELHVLHVAVVLFEVGGIPGELLVERRHRGRQLAEREGRSVSGDNVFALGVGQPVAFDAIFSCRGVP